MVLQNKIKNNSYYFYKSYKGLRSKTKEKNIHFTNLDKPTNLPMVLCPRTFLVIWAEFSFDEPTNFQSTSLFLLHFFPFRGSHDRVTSSCPSKGRNDLFKFTQARSDDRAISARNPVVAWSSHPNLKDRDNGLGPHRTFRYHLKVPSSFRSSSSSYRSGSQPRCVVHVLYIIRLRRSGRTPHRKTPPTTMTCQDQWYLIVRLHPSRLGVVVPRP